MFSYAVVTKVFRVFLAGFTGSWLTLDLVLGATAVTSSEALPGVTSFGCFTWLLNLVRATASFLDSGGLHRIIATLDGLYRKLHTYWLIPTRKASVRLSTLNPDMTKTLVVKNSTSGSFAPYWPQI
jgi:hypothetical protein